MFAFIFTLMIGVREHDPDALLLISTIANYADAAIATNTTSPGVRERCEMLRRRLTDFTLECTELAAAFNNKANFATNVYGRIDAADARFDGLLTGTLAMNAASLVLGSSLSVGGATELTSSLNVAGGAALATTLSVGGAVALASSVAVGGTLLVAGASRLGALTVSGSLSATDTSMSSLNTSSLNTSSLNSSSLTSYTLRAISTLSVGDALRVDGDAAVIGTCTLQKTLSVAGAVALLSSLAVGGALSVAGASGLEALTVDSLFATDATTTSLSTPARLS
ncbi:hypothetical protein T492DRAFT_891831 [Pavlovales sp. CCMP2436]|nr:hypothetical protein T492DRAFT_891831 [Pavlovales sp. CCMP2436]